MTNNAQSCDLILDEPEVARRLELLAELADALQTAGVRCVLARRRRLGPLEPSGPTDPELRIVRPDRIDVATTDGVVYKLASGSEFAVSDMVVAAEAIRRSP